MSQGIKFHFLIVYFLFRLLLEHLMVIGPPLQWILLNSFLGDDVSFGQISRICNNISRFCNNRVNDVSGETLLILESNSYIDYKK